MKQIHILQGVPTEEELVAITTAVVALSSRQAPNKHSGSLELQASRRWLTSSRHEAVRTGIGASWSGNWNKHHHGLWQS